ncbi:Gx transporter family protein [Vogesella oryzae]|uniref:Gx transporter family protein n=1 Tax=Vogesella oryzae TaxID=1735285 RepID=UPI0015830408|nr:Gx transporter family protein [Vogesella oryzae]
MTHWHSDTRELLASSHDHQLARLAACGIVLALLDAALPSPLPGIKPGLANIVTLYALASLGWRAAVWVSLLRIIGAGLLLGSLFTPGFWLSLSGGCGSLLLLAGTRWLPRRSFSVVSYSLLAACGHLGGQLLLARGWLIPHQGLWLLLPPLLTAAVITGLINGLFTLKLLESAKDET